MQTLHTEHARLLAPSTLTGLDRVADGLRGGGRKALKDLLAVQFIPYEA